MPLAGRMTWGAHFEIEPDLKPIFPYINAVVPDARYHDQPEYVQFSFKGIGCTVYSHDIVAAPFDGRDTAQAFIRKLIDFLNDIYAGKNEIEPDYRKYRPISVMDVLKLLPRSNCKKCGYATCLAFAGALRQGLATPDLCPDFSSPIYEYAVYPIYDSDGAMVSTVRIEKNPAHQKEMPDRAIEVQEIQKSPEKKPTAPDATEPALGSPPLTDREKEVLQLMAEGATNNEISKKLCISPHTVKSHVIHIFNKLGVSDRTQAAVLAAKNNLIS